MAQQFGLASLKQTPVCLYSSLHARTFKYVPCFCRCDDVMFGQEVSNRQRALVYYITLTLFKQTCWPRYSNHALKNIRKGLCLKGGLHLSGRFVTPSSSYVSSEKKSWFPRGLIFKITFLISVTTMLCTLFI